MGGNLWFMSDSEDNAILAAENAARAVEQCDDSVMTFPGGIAASASKAGSKYKFLIASTFAEFCPTLKESKEVKSRVPEGVKSIMEIVINGSNLQALINSTQAAIQAALSAPGLIKISAGNYGGRLGKSFIYLHPDKQPA